MNRFYTFFITTLFVISLSSLAIANVEYENFVKEKRAELNQIAMNPDEDSVGKMHDILDEIATVAVEHRIKAVRSRETTLLSMDIAAVLIRSDKAESISMGISMLSTLREDVSDNVLTPDMRKQISQMIVVGLERARMLNKVTIVEP